MASLAHCVSSTSSIAASSAGTGRSPRAWRAFQAASTSCQSSAANRKPGDTGLSASTRSSVCASARVTKRSPSGCSRITSSSGSRPWCRPTSRSCRRQALAWPGQQQLQHLVEQARRRHVLQQRRHLADRLARLRRRAQAELGAKPHRAQHAHRVLAVARLRVADHAQHALLQVGEAAVEVDHLLGRRVVEQRVDGEVAPRRVLLLRAEDVVAQDAAVLVLLARSSASARAEGRDLDRLRARTSRARGGSAGR